MNEEKEKYNLKAYLVGISGFCAGLLLIVISEHINKSQHPILYGVVASVSTTLIVGGLLGLAYEVALRKELVDHFDKLFHGIKGEINIVRDNVDSHMQLSQGIHSLGLQSISPQEIQFDYSDIIRNSKTLFFLFNDGRTWFSHHYNELQNRIETPGLITKVILVHPESVFVSALAVKVDEEVQELKIKTASTIRMLSKISSKDHDLKIIGHFLPSTYSLVMSEDKAIFIPYPMARKADKLPCFVFSANADDGFYAVLKRDINSILQHSASKSLYPVELF